MNDDFRQGAVDLESLFFFKNDQVLIAKLRELEKMKHSKENLAKVSGITDDRILQKLVDVGITPQTLAPLAAIPLIEVAWADGNVDNNERTHIHSALLKMGLKPGGLEHDLIERWLEQKPSPELLSAWVHYVEGICKEMNAEERKAFQTDLMGQAEGIAASSGGMWGLGRKISRKEQEMLDKLRAAFCQ